MSTDKKLAHFVLADRPAARAEGLVPESPDAHVVYENQFLSLMTFDEEHRLGIVQLPQPAARTPMTVGLAHSAYTPAWKACSPSTRS
jgi:hypothetical protein